MRSLPFDEYQVWVDNAEYIRKALDLSGKVHVYKNTDPAVAPGSESAKTLDPQGKVKDVVPLDPEIYPFVAAGSS